MNLWKNNAPKIYLVAMMVQLMLGAVALFALQNAGNVYTYFSYLIPQAANVGVILISMKLMKTPLSEGVPYREKPKPLCLALALPITLGLYCQNLLFSMLFTWFMETVGVPMNVTLPPLSAWWQILLAIPVLCLFPAVGEEMMFRGIIPKTFENRGMLSTVFLSALVFALAHGNAAQLVHQFILGAVLVYLTRKTGTTLYAVIIHFLNNLIALILELTLPDGTLIAPTPANLGILFALFFVGIIILYPSVFLFSGVNSGVPIKEFLKNKEQAKTVLWFDEPKLPEEKTGSWEIGMWTFLVLYLIINTVGSFLA